MRRVSPLSFMRLGGSPASNSSVNPAHHPHGRAGKRAARTRERRRRALTVGWMTRSALLSWARTRRYFALLATYLVGPKAMKRAILAMVICCNPTAVAKRFRLRSSDPADAHSYKMGSADAP